MRVFVSSASSAVLMKYLPGNRLAVGSVFTGASVARGVAGVRGSGEEGDVAVATRASTGFRHGRGVPYS